MTGPVEDAIAMNHANAAAFLAEARVLPSERWQQPRAEGKWSPAQITEHVALGYEVASRMLNGEQAMSGPPKLLRPLVRTVVRFTILRTGRFPKSKTATVFTPTNPAATQADLCARLATSNEVFERQAAAMAGQGKAHFEHPVFGRFGVDEYVRFLGFHIEHHRKQLSEVRS